MTSLALVRPIRAVAWELRVYWARGLRVSLAIDADVSRVEGFVETISPTDAYAVVSGLHVPLGAVLAVYRPSRLGDSSYEEEGLDAWAAGSRVPRDPAQLEIPGLDV